MTPPSRPLIFLGPLLAVQLLTSSLLRAQTPIPTGDGVVFNNSYSLSEVPLSDLELFAHSQPDKGGIPVIDSANLLQNIRHYIERLYEIYQKAVIIVQNYTELAYWLDTLTNLEDYPFRPSINEFLHTVYGTMRDFQVLRGEYQALTYAIDEVQREFDITLPGWTAYTGLSTGPPHRVSTGAGSYSFESPMDYQRYQHGRIRQVLRQSLKTTSRHRHDIRASEEHLALGRDSLNSLSQGTVGLQQILEMQTTYAALTAQQLVALRHQIQTRNGVAIAVESHRLNQRMQDLATLEDQHRYLAQDIRSQWGALIPNPTTHPADSPLPPWIRP